MALESLRELVQGEDGNKGEKGEFDFYDLDPLPVSTLGNSCLDGLFFRNGYRLYAPLIFYSRPRTSMVLVGGCHYP